MKDDMRRLGTRATCALARRRYPSAAGDSPLRRLVLDRAAPVTG